MPTDQTAEDAREALDQIARNFMRQGFSHDESWRRAKMVADAGGVRPDTPFSTRDPRRAGIKAAILARLHDRLKLAAEFSEPGHQNWRKEAGKLELLTELIAEIGEMESENG